MTMLTARSLAAGCVLIALASRPANAADRPLELGTALTTAAISLDENGGGIIGIPTGSFGSVSPGVFATFFPTTHLGIEPQVGLIYVRQGGTSVHLVNVAGQVDYFFRGMDRRSAYLFGGAGFIDASATDNTPKSVSVGIGYRIPSDSLAVRFDARYVHLTGAGESNTLVFGVSLGGLFGR